MPSTGPDLDAALARADLVIVLAGHAAYDTERLAGTARLLLDTRGVTRGLADARPPTVELL